MKFFELFAGAGGMSLGLERAGHTCVGHAEIEPHARAVLRHRWPDVPLYGDVTTLDGAALMAAHPFDLLTGGSPCQDLSVAGKRAGLAGARSGLFFHQHRLWEETGAPYCLWENVAGALSATNGWDFAAVLSAFVGATVPVPADGWRGSGVAAGRTGVAAWRLFDLQYVGPSGVGVPQRRLRLFVLAARAGARDPAEILAVGQRVRGDFAPRREARQDAPGGVAGSLGGSRVGGPRLDLDTHGMYPVQPVTVTGAVTHPLMAEGADASEDGTGRGTPITAQPVGFSVTASQGYLNQYTMPTLPHLNGLAQTGAQMVGAMQPVAFHATQDPISSPECSPALWANAQIGVAIWPDVTMPMMARDYKGPRNFQDGGLQNAVVQMRPRRLLPIECERLMGWPDEHTAHGVKEDGTTYALSDSARYRLIGNGVGAPQAEWIGRRLAGEGGKA